MKTLHSTLILISLSTLAACNSDEDDVITSDNYITTIAETTVTETDTETDADSETETVVSENNLLLNADFEDWSEEDSVSSPDNWTTIDSGISVSASTDIYYSGSSAASVTVNTTSQGDTDFRQSIDVEADTTYTFSTWIYHTEGMVAARVYIDGSYQNYSSPDLVNEWQSLTYDYTASEDKNIEVGLRFYDQTGFDGSEIVYIDNFSVSPLDESDDTSEDDTSSDDETSSEDDSATEDNTVDSDTESSLLLNGDLENWTDSQPDDWTTIDSGITVQENTAIVYSSSTSAQISVNTGSQSSTDFRQSVDVSADTSYTYSTWVYHTDGFLVATLYIDGNYATSSDNSLLNQWQEITYSYSADEDETVEVGLRFYDQTGFETSEIVYIDNLSLTTDTSVDLDSYYDSASDLTGLDLKTALYNIIKDHTTKTYANIWDFMGENDLDSYYEDDGSIIDVYSENPSSTDSYNYTAVTDQCGNYSGEGSCYNREHSFPKSWFDDEYPMYTDIHHLFATDGYVNGKRSNYPFGEVDSTSWVSENGSMLGSASDDLGYSGTVFEPIDEFKGDFARAYFYMATRYEDIISTWEVNSDSADAVLDSSSDYVYEEWVITMLKTWNENDPVSQKELDRNEAAYEFQGNRNPFIDHPEYISQIWAD